MVRILVVNPNSDRAMEAVIQTAARASVSGGATVDCKSVLTAPAFIETYMDELQAGPGMLDLLRREEANYDAFVIACHSDVHMHALREMTRKPVLGIGQSSLHVAAMLGHSFSVIQTTAHSVPMKEDLVRKYGLWDKCASVRAVRDDDPSIPNVIKAARQAVDKDGAEVVVLGCAGLAGREKEVQDAAGVPVVDGVACATALAESLVRVGLTVSRHGGR